MYEFWVLLSGNVLGSIPYLHPQKIIIFVQISGFNMLSFVYTTM